MRYSTTILAFAALAFGGCNPESQPEPPDLVDVMPILPLPPAYEPVSVAGSDDALQLTFRSTVDQDNVALFYRQTFTVDPWTLVSDTHAPDGSSVLYAEVDGSPIWVRISSTPGAPGSTIQLSGALVNQEGHLLDSLPNTSDGEGN